MRGTMRDGGSNTWQCVKLARNATGNLTVVSEHGETAAQGKVDAALGRHLVLAVTR